MTLRDRLLHLADMYRRRAVVFAGRGERGKAEAYRYCADDLTALAAEVDLEQQLTLEVPA